MKVNFCVVFRVGDHFYLPRREEEAWAVTPTEIWAFGTPKTGVEKDLMRAVREAVTKLDSGKMHFSK